MAYAAAKERKWVAAEPRAFKVQLPLTVARALGTLGTSVSRGLNVVVDRQDDTPCVAVSSHSNKSDAIPLLHSSVGANSIVL